MTNLDSILKSRGRGTLLPPSDAYVRSFLYLLYTLIKLYYKLPLNFQKRLYFPAVPSLHS